MRATLFLAAIMFGFAAVAQEEGHEEEMHEMRFHEQSVTFGVAAPYSLHLEGVGINMRMYYNAGERFCIGPEYAWFRKDDVEIVDFDFVVHYVFETPIVGLYPVVGANYTIETETHIEREVHTGVGLLVGAGMHRNFGHFTAFAEYSRVEFGIADQFITAGLMYTIK